MEKPSKNKGLDKFSLTDLENKQSLRTTFKLNWEANDAVAWITKNSGITVKEAIDIMCTQYLQKTESGWSSFLNDLIQSAKSRESEPKKETVRKTLVISKGSWRALNNVSEMNNISRDSLLENLILSTERGLKFVLKELPKKYEKASKIIKELGAEANAKRKELEELLGEDDPVCSRMGIVSIVIDNLTSSIEGYLKNGTPIDPDDFSQS